MYEFQPAEYNNLVAYAQSQDEAVNAVPNSDAKTYSSFYYQYDSDDRVTFETIGGLRTDTFTYIEGSDSQNANVWACRTQETLADGSTDTVYSNFLGQTILEDLHDKASGQDTYTYYEYNGNGDATLAAPSSAIAGYNDGDRNYLTDGDGFGHAVGTPPSGTFTDFRIHLKVTGSGPVQEYAYTQISLSEFNTQADLLEYTSLADGLSAPSSNSYYNPTSVLQESYTYSSRSVANIYGTGVTDTIYAPATDTTYTMAASILSTSDSTTTPTTGYDYGADGYYSGTFQPESIVTTLPAVPTTENGTGAAAKTVDWYDQEGNLAWSEDGNGYFTLKQYDAKTGLLMETVQNVDTTHLPPAITDAMDAVTLPHYPGTTTTVAMPAGDTTSVNVTTDYSYDNQGRLVQTLDPIHLADIGGSSVNVRTATWTVYEDAIYQVITAQGYATYTNGATPTFVGYTLVNPVSVEITDADGNATHDVQATVVSDGSAAWAATTSSTGVSLSTTPLSDLAALGNVTQSRSAYTAWTSYTYENQQLVATQVYYNIPSSGTGTASVVGDANNAADHNYNQTQYGYNANGLLEWMETPNGTIIWNVLDVRGDVLSTWVGTNDNTPSEFAAWLANPSNSTARAYTAGGANMVEVSANLYDADGDVTQTTDYQYASAASDWSVATPTARVTQDFYDWRDRLVATKSGVGASLTAEAADGVERPLTYYVMDNLGNVTGTYVFNGSGVAVTVSNVGDYIDDDTPTVSTDVALNSSPTAALLRSYSTTSYDTLGQVYRTTQYYVNQGTGVITTSSTAGYQAPEVTNNTYDADGNLVAVEDPNGNATTYVYDGLANQTQVIQPAVNVFDSVHRTWTLNVHPTTTTTYDGAGNVVAVEDPDDNVTTYAYDGIGREIAVSEPDPANGANTSSDHGPVTSYTYDAAGELRSVTDPVTTTSYTYDAAGEQLTVSQTDPNPGAALAMKYTYDADGNVLSVTDPNGNVTSYTYDMLDQLATMTQPTVSAGTPLTTYVYDNLGELLSATDPMNRTTTFQYNVLGEQDLETDPSPGSGQTSPSTAAAYDALGTCSPRETPWATPRPTRMTVSIACTPSPIPTAAATRQLTLTMPTGTCSAKPTRTATPRAISTTL